MNISELPIEGCLKITPTVNVDNRGTSSSIFDQDYFRVKTGIDFKLDQFYTSGNIKKGTIRGIHFQDKPFEQEKIVTCTKGAIFDVIIDLREKSQTYLELIYIHLYSEFKTSIYIPKGCAHGFQTMQDNTRVDYLISGKYEKFSSNGIRYNDPLYNIPWPIKKDIIISVQDSSWGDFNAR